MKRYLSVKAFESIPGPKPFPFIGTLPYYYFFPSSLRNNRKYDFTRLHWNGLKKFQEFGPIVREEIIKGTHIVWLYNPRDIRDMFVYEGKYPARRSHLALEKYRMDRPELYKTSGLLPTNGIEWARLRRAFQEPFYRSSSLTSLELEFDEISKDFIAFLRCQKTHSDFLEELKKYFVEITGAFILNTRLGALEQGPESYNSVSSKLINNAFITNANTLETDNGFRLWRYFPTKAYRQISKCQREMETIALNHIHNSKIQENSILGEYLSKYKSKDVLSMVIDSFLAGIDTSAYSFGFLLYHLARNPNVQNKLRESLNQRSFKYGKAVIKESFRLNPVSVGVGRIVEEKDGIVLGGYHIPQGTNVVSQNQVSCRLSEYFPNPNEFIPERWLDKTPDPFLSLPFGFGPRACIGRKIAEQSMTSLLHHLIPNFSFELKCPEEEIDCKSYLINAPDKPLQFIIHPL